MVLVGWLDEIFVQRQPVLVGVEPTSMVGFLATKAQDAQGATWWAGLRPWAALRSGVSDAGTGLQAGIVQMQEHRRQSENGSVEKGLDVFQTQQEAQRVLKTLWKPVERLWEAAELADRAVARVQRHGRDTRGLAPEHPIAPVERTSVRTGLLGREQILSTTLRT